MFLYNLDFIAGSKLWLSSSELNSEIPNFTIFRKNRDGGNGGVFIACKSNIQCKHLEIDTECKLGTCEIELPSGLPLVTVSVYWRPYKNLDYMDNLTDTINCIANDHKNSTIWVAGDLNLPNINWTDNTISAANYSLTLCNTFLNLLTNHGLMQMNLQPTRNNHILDIFLTNRPALICNVQVIRGISNHGAVCVECALTVKSVPSFRRKVYLWNKADFTAINELVTCSY